MTVIPRVISRFGLSVLILVWLHILLHKILILVHDELFRDE